MDKLNTTNRKAKLGGEILASLIKVLENDFTESQASSLSALALYSIAFSDFIREYWNANKEELVRKILESKGVNPELD